MTVEELEALFDKHKGEHIKFERVAPTLSKRRDMHAFMILDLLVWGDSRRIIGAAEHDQIWLDIDLKLLAAVITEDKVIELIRCGVRLDKSIRSLAMFA